MLREKRERGIVVECDSERNSKERERERDIWRVARRKNAYDNSAVRSIAIPKSGYDLYG